ncbi:acyl-CoA oxidase [Armillaria borealis]|uniref:Acyl-CoA oxidase n=1 Tax=Armillaria borealis TaxID=47425 RepID=A0AA39K477_9AGAR|nr:acyl-CoA oxidase [Armillaria borealis]
MNSQSTVAKHPLFRIQVEKLTTDERVALAYKRAKLMLSTHTLTASDVQHSSERFWGLFTDPATCLDIGMFTILAAHVGLTIGTLSRHLDTRPDLRPLVSELLRFEKVGIFLLSERGHGLDAFNIETTATRMSDGSYILNTPREEATKFMPASTPAFGIPKVALVMARLMDKGKDLGCRYFISTRLPRRSGTGPLDFSITSFDHVRLPPTALVAADLQHIAAPERPLEAWWDENWRIQLGSLLIVSPLIYAVKMSAYIVGSYSMHRCITDRKSSSMIPIISFRTQQWPIAHAVAVGYVLDHWYASVIRESQDSALDGRLRHAMAVITKATVVRHFQRCIAEISERCGAQGAVVAEGEILTLCIRLFSELLLKRYTIALPDADESLLAQHAHGLMEENGQLLAGIGDHRSKEFNSLILPQSQPVIEALGHAFAYSAAKKANVPQPILDVYECAVIRQDPAWYSEVGVPRVQQRMREDRAVSSMLPHLRAYISGMNMAEFATAPIVSNETWQAYVYELPVYTGNAQAKTNREYAML